MRTEDHVSRIRAMQDTSGRSVLAYLRKSKGSGVGRADRGRERKEVRCGSR